FAVDTHRLMRAALRILDDILDALALDGRAVDVQHTANHLNPVAGQAYEPLDEIGRIIGGRFENDHVAPVRLRKEDAPAEEVQTVREGISAVPVTIFGDEKIIADEKRRDHRSRRNIEGLKKKYPNDNRDGDGL